MRPTIQSVLLLLCALVALAASRKCEFQGHRCAASGKLTKIYQCNHGRRVSFRCPTGTVCIQSGSSAYCGTDINVQQAPSKPSSSSTKSSSTSTKSSSSSTKSSSSSTKSSSTSTRSAASPSCSVTNVPALKSCSNPYPGVVGDCGWLNYINCHEATTPSSNTKFPPAVCPGTPPTPWSTAGPLSFPANLDGGYGVPLTPAQIYTILSLVWVAENSNGNFAGVVPWYTAYSYIQDIGDGRGYTINLVGFTTATGDFLVFLQHLQALEPCNPLVQYIPDVAALSQSGSSALTGLQGLAQSVVSQGGGPSGAGPINPNYVAATWNTLSDSTTDSAYWYLAMSYSRQYNLSLPISKGQLYDIALNAGISGLESVVLKVTAKAPTAAQSGGAQELAWLSNLQQLWIKQITTGDTSLDGGQPDRGLMWQHLAAPTQSTGKNSAGAYGANNTVPNLQLALPITVNCYGNQITIMSP
ncbi:lysozyme-like domain-containing protein [Polychytrium aggregatum]|uniref:lysozyme-like domain-containing protein n=1 Tax=Polychytrium aggregatum TaxID=110093 RepID=UPI0022FEDBC9|nr:lysozyme-like domain-containing protein [Polychytrium aggregatum]KAI9202745.1 lysozyme-like domain-containing protein [Polychytrium aggregatum]